MSNDLYNLISLKLGEYRIPEKAKIATELHDSIESLMNNQCGEGACYANVFLIKGKDCPNEKSSKKVNKTKIELIGKVTDPILDCSHMHIRPELIVIDDENASDLNYNMDDLLRKVENKTIQIIIQEI